MELLEAVQKRHSVRMYQDREIPDSIKKELLDFIRKDIPFTMKMNDTRY